MLQTIGEHASVALHNKGKLPIQRPSISCV
jgi:hypothetical protein